MNASVYFQPSWVIKKMQLAFGKAAKASTFDVCGHRLQARSTGRRELPVATE